MHHSKLLDLCWNGVDVLRVKFIPGLAGRSGAVCRSQFAGTRSKGMQRTVTKALKRRQHCDCNPLQAIKRALLLPSE